MSATYNPAIFDAADIAAAKRIILTAEDSTTEKRWAAETPYLVDLISRSFSITQRSIILDYGCGIGRLSRELIRRNGCRVIGADISRNMRALAAVYVEDDRFFACSPTMLDLLIEQGILFDLALSVWVLQHCLRPRDDVERLRRALAPSGGLFVVNQRKRVVPTVEKGWADDGIDIGALLQIGFCLTHEEALAAETTTKAISKAASWATYQPRSR
jgi:SAM-dependent methyltransferase